MQDSNEHYQNAMTLLDEIVNRKDDEDFTNESANTLIQASQAHSLAGILWELMDRPV
jgi:hypothetical protein